MVGGSNAHFTANFWRLRPSDFNEASRLGGVPGTALVDWPITYDELEPYYTKAEWELGVSGEPGPFDPPRSRPYPMPPLPVKSSGVLLERGARALGLHAQPSPMAINSQPYNGRPACQHCGFCLFFMCEFRAKSTSMATMLPLAEATGRCEIRSEQLRRARRDRAGRPRHGRLVLRRRRSSCSCSAPGPSCSARTAPRRRGCCSTPSRPASRTASPIRAASVGKHLMFNTYFGVNAQFEHPLNEYKSVQNTRIVFDFYETDPQPRILRRRRHRRALRDVPDHFSRWAGCRRDLPTWGDGFARGLAEQFTRTMFFGDPRHVAAASRSNSVTIDPSLKDAWGLPCMRVTYKDHPDDLKNAEFLSSQALRIAQAAGALKTWPQPVQPQTQSVHLLGTCRMGNDPRTSVVDKFHRTHDVRNLFICDGSSMVTSSRGQPTETISALAFRAGEHIAAFAKRGEI